MAWSRIGSALGGGLGAGGGRKKRASIGGEQNPLREALRARGGARNVGAVTVTDIEDNSHLEKPSGTLDWLDLKAFAPKALQEVVDKLRVGDLPVAAAAVLRRGSEVAEVEEAPGSPERELAADAAAAPAVSARPASGLRSALQARGGAVRASPSPTAADLAAAADIAGEAATAVAASPLPSVAEDEEEVHEASAAEAAAGAPCTGEVRDVDVAEAVTTPAAPAVDTATDVEEVRPAEEAEPATSEAQADENSAEAAIAAPEAACLDAVADATAASCTTSRTEDVAQDDCRLGAVQSGAGASTSSSNMASSTAVAISDDCTARLSEVSGGDAPVVPTLSAERPWMRKQSSGSHAGYLSSTAVDRRVSVTLSATGYHVAASMGGQRSSEEQGPASAPKLAPEPPRRVNGKEGKLKDLREFWGQNKNSVGFAGPQLGGSRLSRNEAQATLQRLVAAGGDFDEVRRLRKLIADLE